MDEQRIAKIANGVTASRKVEISPSRRGRQVSIEITMKLGGEVDPYEMKKAIEKVDFELTMTGNELPEAVTKFYDNVEDVFNHFTVINAEGPVITIIKNQIAVYGMIVAEFDSEELTKYVENYW